MSFQSDIYDALFFDAGVSALVGSRVFYMVADGTTTTPYLVYQIITTDGETPHNGVRNLSFPQFQVSAWANGGSEAIALAKAVTDALDGKLLTGDSNLTVVYDDQRGIHDEITNLFGEVIDFRGHCNRN